MTLSTIQSSAYMPPWEHFNRSHLSSLAMRNAILYLGPSFSNSAITHAVMTGMHLARNVSMSVSSKGSFRCTVCERKFVSIRMEYGGTRASLCWKKRAEETCGLYSPIYLLAYQKWGSDARL